MTRKYPMLILVALILFVLAVMGCEKAESADTATEINSKDPIGAVVVGLDAGGTTKIDRDIYIDEAFNLTGAKGTYFVNFGSVKRLDAVDRIPKEEWVTSTPAIKGYGYIAYSIKNDQFYRIYLPEYLPDNSGFYAKCQGPFYGRDVAIELPDASINVTSEGQSQVYEFKNSDITVLKSVESSVDWCTVSSATTLKYPFLTNAVQITVDKTLSDKSETSKVDFTTGYH